MSDVRSKGSWELVPAYALVWAAALAHVVYLHVQRESFGLEATLAALVVVGLPVLAARSLMDIKER